MKIWKIYDNLIYYYKKKILTVNIPNTTRVGCGPADKMSLNIQLAPKVLNPEALGTAATSPAAPKVTAQTARDKRVSTSTK